MAATTFPNPKQNPNGNDMGAAQSLFPDSLLLTLGKEDQHQSLSDTKTGKKNDADDYPDLEPYDDEPEEKTAKASANKVKVAKPAPLETSVITLYVSGRKPGEFSTVLSTVTNTIDAANTLLQKRAVDFVDVYNAEGSDVDEIYMPAETRTNELNLIEASHKGADTGATAETQSLESILGDVSDYVNTHTQSFLF